MTTTKGIPLGLLLIAPVLGACCQTDSGNGTVKSLHGEGTSRPYVVCRAGDTYREITLTDSVLKQVKVGDTCPTFETPAPATTERPWR